MLLESGSGQPQRPGVRANSWGGKVMAEKTVRRHSVSRRTMLVATAGMLGGAGLQRSPAHAQSNAAPVAATSGNFPPGSRYGDPAWWAQRKEEILGTGARGGRSTHHHLWDRDEHRYLLDQLLADTGSGHKITHSVFVEFRSVGHNLSPRKEEAYDESWCGLSADRTWQRYRGSQGVCPGGGGPGLRPYRDL